MFLSETSVNEVYTATSSSLVHYFTHFEKHSVYLYVTFTLTPLHHMLHTERSLLLILFLGVGLSDDRATIGDFPVPPAIVFLWLTSP
jgi:hypothetical protein